MYPCQERSGMEVRGEYGAAAEVRSTSTDRPASEEPCYGCHGTCKQACVRLTEVHILVREERVRGLCLRVSRYRRARGHFGIGECCNIACEHECFVDPQNRARENIPKNLARMSKVVTTHSPLSQPGGSAVTRQSSSRQVQDETDVSRRQVRSICWGAGSGAWMNVRCSLGSQAH